MSRKKHLSIADLKAKQAEITAQLAQAEQAERAVIGREVQRVTGLTSWSEISINWQLILRNSAGGKTPKMASDDEPFLIKNPFKATEK